MGNNLIQSVTRRMRMELIYKVASPSCKQGMWISRAENGSTAGSLSNYVTGCLKTVSPCQQNGYRIHALTHINTNKQTNKQTHTHTNTRTHARTHARTHTHTHTHTRTNGYGSMTYTRVHVAVLFNGNDDAF